jgi:hypothetical protein
MAGVRDQAGYELGVDADARAVSRALDDGAQRFGTQWSQGMGAGR